MPDVITAAMVRERLDYDPTTGWFVWLDGKRRGQRAGCVDHEGYRLIRMGGRNWREHRLAWLWVRGEWPKGMIDHINGQRDDNRIANLRDVDNAANQQNKRGGRGVSKHLGVCWAKDTQKWQAQIKVDGKCHYLGQYATEDEASAAYQAAKARLHRLTP